MKRKVEDKKVLNIHEIEIGTNKITLKLEKDFLKNDHNYSIVLRKEKEDHIWRKEAQYIDIKESKLTFDLENLYSHIGATRKCVWVVSLVIEENDKKEEYKLIHKAIKKSLLLQDKKYFNRVDRVTDLIGEFIVDDTRCIVFSVFNERAQLSIVGVTEDRYLEEIIMGKVLQVDMKKNLFTIKVRYPKTKYHFEKLLFQYRTKKSSDKAEYEFTIYKIIEKKEYEIIHASIDLSEIDFKPVYWDVIFMVGDGEKSWPIDIKNQSRIFLFRFCSLFYNKAYRLPNHQFVFPYVTLVKKISLQCREEGQYDGFEFKMKERLALLRYLLTYPYLKHKKIFLVYEKFCYMAQDNGYYFFKYCMENEIEKKTGRKIYYIIDKDSPDYEILKPYKDNVIQFMSIRHISYLLASRLLISTDFKAHAYAWRKRGSILEHLIRKKKLVFLQHGVTAFKKVDFLYGKNRTGGCNLFVVTSDFEKEIVAKNFDYKEKEIAVTGFARWDVLHDKSSGSKEIILMPTWRNWLEEMNDEEFKKSNYYLNYMKLLNTPRLHKVLEKYDLTMNFYLHPKFKEYISNFVIDAKRIRFIPFGEEPLNELMMKCRMLITDYSSVAWDTFYQYKPVVFYQFDLEEYNETHGSYIDMKHDLFGERVEEVEQLIDLIEMYADKQFELEAKFRAMHEQCFRYIDDNNSQRICEHIMKKGW